MRPLLCLLVLLASAAPAHALTIGLDDARCASDSFRCEAHLTAVAAPGEVNDVVVEGSPSGPVRLVDRGTPVRAGRGCTQVSEHEATCSDPLLVLDLGDGDDVATVSGVGIAEGGAGDDRLFGGDGSDTLGGGPGTDVVIGGAGDDRLLADDALRRPGAYELRRTGPVVAADDVLQGGRGEDTVDFAATAPVHIDLARGQAGADLEDGLSSIENASGGLGDDVVAGDSGSNVLDGGGGRDSVLGRAGRDTLRQQGSSSVRYDAGAGADVVEIESGAADVTCGTGRDLVRMPTTRSRLRPGCERVDPLDADAVDILLPLRRVAAPAFALRMTACPSRLTRCATTVTLRVGRRGRVLMRTRLRRTARRGVAVRPIALSASAQRLLAARKRLTVSVTVTAGGRRGAEFTTELRVR